MISNKNDRYVSDILQDIKSLDDIKITHFRSADIIWNESKDSGYVIYSHDGITCQVAKYDSWLDYTDHIGKVILAESTYTESLLLVESLLKG